MSSLIGKTLGQFQILELIGQGALTTVYKAYQPELDRYAAVKVFHRAYSAEQSLTLGEWFRREARAIARLNEGERGVPGLEPWGGSAATFA